MRALFRDKKTNRLRVTPITLALFAVMLVAFSMVYKMGKSMNQVLVSVEHMFEPQPEPVPAPEAVVKPVMNQPEKPQPQPVAQKKLQPAKPQSEKPQQVAVKKPVEHQKTEPKTPITPEPEKKSAKKVEKEKAKEPVKTPKAAEPEPVKQMVAQKEPVKKQTLPAPPETTAAREPEKPKASAMTPKALASATPAQVPPPVSLKPETVGQKTQVYDNRLDHLKKTVPVDDKKVSLVSDKMKTLIEQAKQAKPSASGHMPQTGPALTLDSKAYFEVYKGWQSAGDVLNGSSSLVALRIVNLENVYDLFQMKVVAVKDDTPHIDLIEQSRIAGPALTEFSTTCFLVSDPWGKWGPALKTSGYSKNDNIQVRYYTYDFVRNAIYARAMKAFAWSLQQKNLPKDTDPSTADVLGVVRAVKRSGGGSFGVFIPTRVDFASHGTVMVDALACFSGARDIEALNQAGLL